MEREKKKEVQRKVMSPPSTPVSSTQDVSIHTADAFKSASITALRSKGAPVMGGIGKDLKREVNSNRSAVFDLQRYFVENRTRDIFKTSTVHVPKASDILRYVNVPTERQKDLLSQCPISFYVDKTFEEPIKYEIRTEREGKPLVEVVIPEQKTKWNVVNGTLFEDLDDGCKIGSIHYISSMESYFLFSPNKELLLGVPNLEMQPAKGDFEYGAYDLFVAGIERRIGNVHILRHFFDLQLKSCTKEEAVLWLIILVAAELETKSKLAAHTS
ncbi:unnamed protein product [Agarophyton chilense]|eukprot:gb/GEZJ01001549.1/.p1 GENE.gb/GEZJ01001549.1/~~gb/GEZJ01001549.1/.p1  ORF type:complete len:271 (-),score=44.69 gb/GEZJ01001549.1/:1991-2803(-)